MSTSKIPEKTKYLLWGKAAGRCEYPGCNKSLYRDETTQVEFNSSYIAHIVADSPRGPRGDKVLSKKLAKDIANLMLLCDKHHRLVDKEQVSEHPPELLASYKKAHEDRIERLTGIDENHQTLVLLYGANIGVRDVSISKEIAFNAVAQEQWFPATPEPIRLGFQGSTYQDHESDFWSLERTNLTRQFDRAIKSLPQEARQHFSVFALAPQPLLAHLGFLLSDLQEVEIYQKQRDPDSWNWHPKGSGQLVSSEVKSIPKAPDVALIVAVSAPIAEERIADVLGSDTPIWRIGADEPGINFLRARHQLEEFRKVYRQTLDQIKTSYGNGVRVHIFIAAPVAIAVETGRCWNPKSHPVLILYDHNSKHGTFVRTFEIGST